MVQDVAVAVDVGDIIMLVAIGVEVGGAAVPDGIDMVDVKVGGAGVAVRVDVAVGVRVEVRMGDAVAVLPPHGSL
jgi:hypothetical protein